MLCCCIFFYFFFQAEDGIRDWSVTGVQTCALPISVSKLAKRRPWNVVSGFDGLRIVAELARVLVDAKSTSTLTLPLKGRSEERRVGKECRSRWSAYH